MKQNLTIRLSKETVHKAKILAARRSTSISGLVEAQIAALVDADDANERAKREAFALLASGFHLGAEQPVDRASLHER
jgi:predicted transcriptional regulator